MNDGFESHPAVVRKAGESHALAVAEQIDDAAGIGEDIRIGFRVRDSVGFEIKGKNLASRGSGDAGKGDRIGDGLERGGRELLATQQSRGLALHRSIDDGMLCGARIFLGKLEGLFEMIIPTGEPDRHRLFRRLAGGGFRAIQGGEGVLLRAVR